MPYLTKIGPTDSTSCGMCSRGYHIFRRGKIVHAYWGQIDLITKRIIKPYWKYKKNQSYNFRTEEKAVFFLDKKVEALLKNGYELLPAKVKIYPPRRK